jgi:hypothetical protein
MDTAGLGECIVLFDSVVAGEQFFLFASEFGFILTTGYYTTFCVLELTNLGSPRRGRNKQLSQLSARYS